MKFVFSTSKINAVGVKLYFCEELQSQFVVQGGAFPVFIETDKIPESTMTFEVCRPSEVISNQEPQRYGELLNSQLYGYEFKGCSLNEGLRAKNWQVAYKSVIENVCSCGEKLFLDFDDINGDAQCGVVVAALGSECNAVRQKYVRRYGQKQLTRGLIKKIT